MDKEKKSREEYTKEKWRSKGEKGEERWQERNGGGELTI